MEELILTLFAVLAMVAWGLGLIGVPMLFQRIKKLELRINELSIRSPSNVAEQATKAQENNELANAIYDHVETVGYKEDALPSSDTDQAVPDIHYQTEPDLSDADVNSEPTQPVSSQPSWLERQLSTNLTAKIGAIVLIFGAVFLAKYTADIGVFTITARLWLMALSGIAMAVVGWRLVQSRRLYADILQGTGFAVWLSTWFAAHILYEQVGWILTLCACLIGVIFIGYRAIKQNSQVLAFIGLLGGFIAPFIASSDASSLWRLFSYMLVMNIAVAVITINKPWRWFLRLGYLGSFLLLSLLMTAEYLQGDLAILSIQSPMLVFILGLVIIYSLLAAKWLIGGDPQYQRIMSGLLISVPSMAALAVYGLFKEQALVTASVFFIAALWFGLLWLKVRQWPLMAIGIVAATMAIPFALSDSLSSLVYSLEGAAFFAFAVRQKRWVYLAWASIIQVAALLFSLNLFTNVDILEHRLYLAWPLFGAVIAAGLFSAWRLFSQGGFDRFNVLIQKILIAWSIFWWLYLWGFYCAEILTRQQTVLICIALMPVTLLLLEWAYLKTKWSSLIYFQIVFSVIIFLSALLYFYDYSWSKAIVEKLIIVALLCAFFVVRFYYSRLRTPLWFGESLLLWFGITGAMGLILSQTSRSTTDWSIVWALLPLVIMFNLHKLLLPTLFRNSDTRVWVIRISVAVMLLTSLITTAALGNYAPWPFLVVIHPMSLMIVALGYGLFKLRQQDRLVIVPSVIWAGLMLTLEANRFLFHYLGVKYNIDSWLASAITQTVWSLMWSVIGASLMVFGSRIQVSKRVWISGALALTLVVIKLFVLDLNNVDTLYRILSFIGVGALLLAVGYFAPLPAEKDAEITKV